MTVAALASPPEHPYETRLTAFLEALAREPGSPLAGTDPADLDYAPLMDGRTGSYVTRVHDRRCRARLVIKTVRRRRALSEGMGTQKAGEGPLWLSGATARLPLPLACPTLAVRHDLERDEWWLVMRDVSDGVVPRGQWTAAHTRRLLEALVPLHAQYWEKDEELAVLPLATLAGATRPLAEPFRRLITDAAPEAPWVERLIEEMPFFPPMLRLFLETIEPADADFFRHLVGSWATWLPLLESGPSTLLHGDLRRANIAFEPDRVVLFDWDFAARGPAAADLQNHWFFQFWAYPPADGQGPEDRDGLRDYYLERLEAALGRRVDRVQFARDWDLAWLRELVRVSFCLIDPLMAPSPTAEDRARVAETCRRAIALARYAYDRHVQ